MDSKMPGRGRETSDSVRGAIVALRLVSKCTFHEIGKALSVEPETACHIFNRARSRAPSEDLRDILASVGNAKRPGAPIKPVELSVSSRLPRHIRLKNRRARDAAKKQKAAEERAKGDEPATATTHHPPNQENHPTVNESHENHQDSPTRQTPCESSPTTANKSEKPSKLPPKEQDKFRFAPVNQVSKGQPARFPPPRPPPPLLPPPNIVPNTLPVYAPTAPPVAVTAFPALANPRNGHPVPIPRTMPVARS